MPCEKCSKPAVTNDGRFCLMHLRQLIRELTPDIKGMPSEQKWRRSINEDIVWRGWRAKDGQQVKG